MVGGAWGSGLIKTLPNQPACLCLNNIYCHMLVAAGNFKGSCVEAMPEASKLTNIPALSCQIKPQNFGEDLLRFTPLG